MSTGENSPEERQVMGREHPGFVAEYAYDDRESGESHTAPFPVAVFGIHQEFFGVGNVIGVIDDNPVIEVQDRDDGKPYFVMGYESWWTHPVPDEVVEGMASGELTIDSVAAYRTKQDDYWDSVCMADGNFLDESGIDPDSL